MKQIISILILTFLISQNINSQKLYVWCQKEQIPTPRKQFLKGIEVDLVVFDSRILTPKSRIKCESEKIIENFTELIKATYSSAKINLLKSELYFKKPENNRITIKISISAYHSAFGANVKVGIGNVGGKFSWGVFPEGKWNALTGYSLKIYDYRDSKKEKFTHNIGKIVSRPNTGGYWTAKNILNSSYIQANQELFLFIDNSLME
jgi:hypothetical protein